MSSGIMKAHTLIASIGLQSVIIVIIVVSLVASPVSSVNIQKSRFPTNSQPWNSSNSTRRILHQPLFPASSSPPPDTDTDNTDTSPPPSPPSPSSTYNPDQPFFPEVPTTPTPDDQISSPPPPPPPISQSSNGEASVPIPTATQPTKPTKKVAIALSVGIVTLGMLSGLAFYLYKHRQKQTGDTHKLVGDGNRSYNSDESRGAPPPSSFLYIGTVEPSSQRSIDETNDNIANGSPYHKLNTAKKMTDRYRPSPDLQPLPPLNRAVAPAPPPNARSPPPPTATTGSSSDGDDEGSLESAFYTPQGSIASYDDAFSTPASRHSHRSNGSSRNSSSRGENHGGAAPPVPYSKRTSPRSRPSASSPDVVKHAIIPSIKTAQPPRPSEENGNAPETKSRLPRRTNFPPLPPAPPNLALHSISNQSSLRPPKFAAPPPPPPPPPPPGSMPRKTATHIPNISSVAPHSATLKSQSQASDFQLNNPSTEKPEALKDVDDGCSSSTGPDDDDDMAGSRPKLKALHWDKVRATSDRATVWDQLNSSSFQLNEEMMTSLFGNNSNKNVNNNSVQGQVGRRSVLPPVEQQNRVLDPKKSQNIAILLRALNVTRDEVSEALLDGNPEGLGPELLETLVKMAPTKEEEIKLKDYKGDVSKLGSAERFLKAILDIPFAFHRVEAMLYRANFDAEVKYLRKSYDTLEAACGELKNSRLFFKLLEAVLSTGNRMNVGTNRGGAKAFKLDTLLKLADVKGTDGKTTLLHFVVQEIIRSEVIDNTDTTVLEDQTNNSRGGGEQTFKRQGLQVVSGLGRELCNVKLAAGMDSEVLNNYVLKLEMGLEKVRSVLQRERRPEELPGGRRFFDSMKAFLKEAEQGISKIKDEERKALILVREVTEYFHGNATKEEAHPFRIFMIVRDFLSILDHVCKDVGKMQERTVMGAARSFRISANAPLPVHNRYNARREVSSDEESSSP